MAWRRCVEMAPTPRPRFSRCASPRSPTDLIEWSGNAITFVVILGPLWASSLTNWFTLVQGHCRNIAQDSGLCQHTMASMHGRDAAKMKASPAFRGRGARLRSRSQDFSSSAPLTLPIGYPVAHSLTGIGLELSILDGREWEGTQRKYTVADKGTGTGFAHFHEEADCRLNRPPGAGGRGFLGRRAAALGKRG